MEAKFTVILKNNQPWLRWDQYEVNYLRIWKSNSETPYVKYNGYRFDLTEDMKKELKALVK